MFIIHRLRKTSAVVFVIGIAHLLVQQVYAAPAFIFKSVDVMKYTKDVMTNQPDDASVGNLIDTLKTLDITHVALSIPMDETTDYPSSDFPAPRTAEVFTQTYADAVHTRGLGIIWRGTFSGIEGIYNFPKLLGSERFPAGTALSAETDGTSTWLGKVYQYIVKNPSYFADGDIWAPLPERTEGIFSDNTAFLPATSDGLQADYTHFFIDLKTVSDTAFTKIGKQVSTGLSANNYTEVKSTWIPQFLFDTAQYTVIDYYGDTHTSTEMDSDIRSMANTTGKPVFLQEWSDYWNQNLSESDRTTYLTEIYSVLKKLSTDGILAGLNYWGGWDNNAEGILTKDSDGFHVNYRGHILANFFGTTSVPIASSSTVVDASTTVSTPIDVVAPVVVSIGGGGGGGGGYVAPVVQATSSIITSTSTTVSDVKTATTTAPVSKKLPRDLKRGMRGSDVVYVQKKLSVKQTGYFGVLTEQAVKKFQTKNHIVGKNSLSYGVVGPVTRSKILI